VVIRKISWKKILGYWIAQYSAAFVSSVVVFGIYYGKLCLIRRRLHAAIVFDHCGAGLAMVFISVESMVSSVSVVTIQVLDNRTPLP